MKRDFTIDLIKVIAMLCIIALHVFPYRSDWSVTNLLYDASVMGIPLFLMSSGYLLIGEERVSDKRYILRKFYRIIRFIVLFASVVWALKLLMHQAAMSDWIHYLTGAFLQKGPAAVCWYLGAMLIIYLLLPLINRLYCNRKSFIAAFLVLTLIEFFCFTQNLLKDTPWEQSVPQMFRIWNWLYYFMLGGIVKLLSESSYTIGYKSLAWCLLILLPACIFFQEHFKAQIGSDGCEFFYSSFIVALLAFTAFISIKGFTIPENSLLHKVLAWISPCFLWVYVTHPLIVTFTSQFVNNPFALYLIVLVISVTFSKVVVSIPILKKLTSL